MEIKVNSIEEHEDGTATLHIDMDDETKVFLINHAVVDIIRKACELFKKDLERKANEGTSEEVSVPTETTI